jgi:uncharacterized protein
LAFSVAFRTAGSSWGSELPDAFFHETSSLLPRRAFGGHDCRRSGIVTCVFVRGIDGHVLFEPDAQERARRFAQPLGLSFRPCPLQDTSRNALRRLQGWKPDALLTAAETDVIDELLGKATLDVPAMPGKFEVHQDKAGKHRFRLKAANGEVVAVGAAYESQSGAHAGCEAIERAAASATIMDVDA